MKKIHLAIAIFASAAFPASAQTPARPRFEVAAIRAAAPGTAETTLNGAVLFSLPPVFTQSGMVTVRNTTIRQLMRLAYKEIIGPDYLTGKPDLFDSDRFDLVAKAPPNTPADTQRLMIQTVLAERFHLQVHREEKAMPVWALVMGKNGPKLHPAAASGDHGVCPRVQMSPEGLIHKVCQNVPMDVLVQQLPVMAPNYVDHPVVDLTGLTGAYDFQLDWAARPADGVTPGTTIFEALEKQLGLKLEPRKLPMPIIVVDHVDRAPTEN
jgi:uncharacterized protein (TIGR03435 family)